VGTFHEYDEWPRNVNPSFLTAQVGQRLPRPPAEVRLVSGCELLGDDRRGSLLHEYRWAA